MCLAALVHETIRFLKNSLARLVQSHHSKNIYADTIASEQRVMQSVPGLEIGVGWVVGWIELFDEAFGVAPGVEVGSDLVFDVACG